MNREPSVQLRLNLFALLIAILIPSILAWTCSILLSGKPIVFVVYVSGKTAQLAFPLVWTLAVERKTLGFPRRTTKGLMIGTLFGCVVVLFMLAVYHGVAAGNERFVAVANTVRLKLDSYGVKSAADFYWAGSYFVILHTLAEEYYWRWFVFGKMRQSMIPRLAIFLSGLAFAAHHVLLAKRYFGDQWGMVALFSASVAVSGMVWAWLYQRSGSLFAPWISHLIVDAGLVWIGFELWRG